MRVKSVSFTGAYGPDQPFPEPIGPEFVFIGRSNVGKSSLINTLVGRRNIARTSNTPGKTRTANFYPVNDELCFVDMPGYGFAQVSKGERAKWEPLIRDYLENREALHGIIHLLDVRHSPSADDRRVTAELRELGKPLCLIFTKIDKIKRGQVERSIGQHLAVLAPPGDAAVVPFSAETGSGKKQLWAWIQHCLSL